MKKIVPILTVLFLLSLPCLAYDGDYDDDTVSISEAFRVFLYGAGVGIWILRGIYTALVGKERGR